MANSATLSVHCVRLYVVSRLGRSEVPCCRRRLPHLPSHSAGSQEARSTDTSFLQSSSAGCRTTYTPTKTTVMLRNIPWGFSRDSLTSLLDKHGFNGLYDFVYMPMNFRSEAIAWGVGCGRCLVEVDSGSRPHWERVCKQARSRAGHVARATPYNPAAEALRWEILSWWCTRHEVGTASAIGCASAEILGLSWSGKVADGDVWRRVDCSS